MSIVPVWTQLNQVQNVYHKKHFNSDFYLSLHKFSSSHLFKKCLMETQKTKLNCLLASIFFSFGGGSRASPLLRRSTHICHLNVLSLCSPLPKELQTDSMLHMWEPRQTTDSSITDKKDLALLPCSSRMTWSSRSHSNVSGRQILLSW